MLRSRHFRQQVAASVVILLVAACSDGPSAPDTPPDFIRGTGANHQIGIVVNSTGKALTLFQLGSPATQKQIPLGTSSTVTPTGFSVQGDWAAVPLGNAASVVLVHLTSQTVGRYFTFASGNTTGSAFSDDSTLFVANSTTGVVGRVTASQAADSINTVVAVAPQPTAITYGAGRILVTSANLDENFEPIGNGIVTAIDPKTMQVVGTATTGGTNSTDAAIGPDGLLYVLNTGDYVADGSITVVDPATMQVLTTTGGMGPGPGAISIDAKGLAYISGFFTGTIVWNTKTRSFIRGTDNPVCAKLANGSCRGAFATEADASGNVYQLFFGSAPDNLPPYTFVYRANTFALVDSVSVGVGPSAIHIRSF